MPIAKRCLAEFIGTFWLVLGGCGAAVLAATYTKNTAAGTSASAAANFSNGIGVLGVALAFGLTVLTMAYAIGHISGCHLNPAVSFGLWAAKRFKGSDLLPYIIAQVLGAIVAAGLLYLIATGKQFELTGSNPLATNGFGEQSPAGYPFITAVIVEFVMTFMFLMIILGSTDGRAPAGFAPTAIGLGLTLIHLISIPVTNTSVNPARSTGPALIVALFGRPDLLKDLWVFWAVPILGAIAAGFLYNAVFEASRFDSIETRESENIS